MAASGTGGVEAVYAAEDARLFQSDFDRVVTETWRLGAGAAKGTSRQAKAKKP